MLTIGKVKIPSAGIDIAMHGMRNSWNSWKDGDSEDDMIGPQDLSLAKNLANKGGSHAKYRRMIVVYADIKAPLYFWKEFDTYKIGTVTLSCSTMHTLANRNIELKDFSWEKLYPQSIDKLEELINEINRHRADYAINRANGSWWQLIQLLPSSYNQQRTVMLNYEVLHHIYQDRKVHRLDEWRKFCDWIRALPYADDLIICEEMSQ